MTWFKKLFKAPTGAQTTEPKETPAQEIKTSPEPSKPFKRDFKGKTLGQKQRMFTLMIAELIQYAYSLGYELSVGDFYRDERLHGKWGVKNSYSSAHSTHKVRLAGDLNLFIDGVYQTSTEAHKPLGEYWEAMGGTWGGRFQDGNHYSIEHQGYK